MDPPSSSGPSLHRDGSAEASQADAQPAQTDVPAVRFSSAVEEINPDQPRQPAAAGSYDDDSVFTDVTVDQVNAFKKSMHNCPLQERRLNTFQFEPFSLPPSRVASREESIDSSKLSTPNTPVVRSPHGSPRLNAMASPPLTPAGSDPEKRLGREPERRPTSANDPSIITPQQTSSQDKVSFPERRTLPHRSASSDHFIGRSSSAEERNEEQKSHRREMFAIGPGSVPVSRETSPSRTAASHFYSKPMTPVGDLNDPYAKGRRPPQQPPNRHSIDPRFVFSRKKKGSSSSSKHSQPDKRLSGAFGGIRNSSDDLAHSESASTSTFNPNHTSMSDLKRFFRKSTHHKKRDSSPAASIKTGTKTPLSSRSTQQIPFSEDHGLTSKYGKLGKVLGSGAGGSVRLMRRKEDQTVFAVKEFRARHAYETEKEYNKKVTAEFCVGSTLHHGNIIETLDILHEKGRWYEVMEYAPFDLFAIVMTGKMSREEITCCFLQILNGVTYLHSLGLAHRDLKLDNVVVSDKGIMKIIDFGSAHVFKYPFETDPVPAKGIVGSDPYLAPEVYDSKEYDAAAVDIWSLAIIFCCMTLRRFPWKIPRMTDNSFKLFAAEPTPGHDPGRLIMPSKSMNDLGNTTAREFLPDDSKESGNRNHGHHGHHGHHHNHHSHHKKETDDAASTDTARTAKTAQSSNPAGSGEKKEVIRGPWRILRLLPRESRRIIHRMLELDPKKRAKMDEILAEQWVADTVICQQLDSGEVVAAQDHTHILEPPTSQQQQQQQPAQQKA